MGASDKPDENRNPKTGKFLPGNNANPNGRPKGRTFAEAMERLLKEPSLQIPGLTRAEALAEKVLTETESELPAWLVKEVLKRVWQEKTVLELSGAFQASIAAGIGVTHEPDKLAALMDVIAEAGLAAGAPSGDTREAGEEPDP